MKLTRIARNIAEHHHHPFIKIKQHRDSTYLESHPVDYLIFCHSKLDRPGRGRPSRAWMGIILVGYIGTPALIVSLTAREADPTAYQNRAGRGAFSERE